jgi:hypothetical protein
MSEEKKVLSIDPNLFSFSKNNSTKKREKKQKPDKELKIKSQPLKKKTDTLKKKSILKMIRQHQEERYKQAFNEKTKKSPIEAINSSNDFNKDFKEAQLFLQNLTEKKETENAVKQNNMNQTLKRYSGGNINSVTNSIHQASIMTPQNQVLSTPVPRNYKPLYGCLKGGSLPTYRNYINIAGGRQALNTTGKYQPPILIGSKNKNNATSQYDPANMQNIMSDVKKEGLPPTQQAIVEHVENRISESMKLPNIINQTAGKIKQSINQKKNKRKKILRRTFKIGKSKVHPKVAVLVSNKTLRQNITTKHQLLKQTPITDVKKFLMKRGFIKIGSIAPNDVLRKMYEDVTMMCGDIQNHNPENLLYNFLNANDK